MPESEYERRLLSEVVTPSEIGVGFDDIGALENVKTTLREVCQQAFLLTQAGCACNSIGFHPLGNPVMYDQRLTFTGGALEAS
jgi:hypothetical protein